MQEEKINISKRKRDLALVLDIERTTWRGRPPKGMRQEIIEIGVATFNFHNGFVEKKESIFIKTQNSEVSDFCQELTGISQDFLDKNGITIQEAMRKLWKRYESNKRMWMSWGESDRMYLSQDCRFYEIQNPMHLGYLDVRDLFISKYNYEPSLTTALQEVGLEFQGDEHSGLADAYNTALLYKNLIGK